MPNYTGDRLNFGLSYERVKSEQPDLKIEMLVIGEDCALLPSVQSAGRRGLCGQVLVNKVGKLIFFACMKSTNPTYYPWQKVWT